MSSRCEDRSVSTTPVSTSIWLSGRLMAARCTELRRGLSAARARCARAATSTDMEWVELSGRRPAGPGLPPIYVGLPGMASQGYTRENPYCSRRGPAGGRPGHLRPDPGRGLRTARRCLVDGDARCKRVFVERMSGENRRVYLVFEPKVEPSEESTRSGNPEVPTG